MDVAGKTGTAEVDVYHPNHGMFIGYAPASDPEYAIAVRIENGYSSGNACLAADDIFKYIFELADEQSILTGVAASDTSDTSNDYPKEHHRALNPVRILREYQKCGSYL